MDLDFLDLDALSSWTFDPHSPLWLFEDRPDVWTSISCNSEIVNGYTDEDDIKKQKFQMLTVDNSSDGSCLIRERMTQALRFLKESTDQHVLAQVWAPVKSGDKYVLTTSGQPFVLDPQSLGLHHYRTASVMYVFSVDGDGAGDLGLPGRVFRRRLPEWTPNVQYYSSKEYPRLSHAVNYNVQGTLALPVFEPSAQSCVGVLELILTSQKINYAPEVDKVCKALEAVNLKSYEILDHPSVQICNEGRQAALAEILEILAMVCEAHKLPLAQTWVPCRHRSVLAHGGGYKKSCSSFDGSCMGQVCMSTTDVAFYVIDAHMWRFRDACVEHHLQEGQGVAGRAFASRSSCFSKDITQFCKTEYPLVHYARIFGLAGCYAICLQSIHTGSDDYILEFFLPSNCKDPGEQQTLLNSITSVMKQYFRSLKMIDDVNLLDEGTLKVTDVLANEDQELEHEDISGQSCKVHIHTKSPERKAPEGISHTQNEENEVSDVLPELHLLADVNAKNIGDPLDRDSRGNRTSASLFVNTSERKLQRKRGKAEKSISLEVLQQYFCGSLKDAAKSLGVCPTTMKRICRQHGISRWPSRKINKVNRSLTKLKRVIESVQGAEGAFNLPSFTCPPPSAIGTVSWAANLDAYKQTISTKPLNPHGQVNKDLSLHKAPENDDGCNNLKAQPTSSHPDHGNDSHVSESRSSSAEGSMDTPIFQELSEGSPVYPIASSNLGNGFNFIEFSRLNKSVPDVIEAKPPTRLCGMLMEDSGSSKDLGNLFNSVVEGCHANQFITPIHNNPSKPVAIQDTENVIIKASYKEDIIRFRLPFGAGVVALTDEVAKRLKLEVGTFDIKYLDDDQEWVMLASDADLEECIEISGMSGVHTIRLLVHDIISGIGSSCGSSE